MSTSRKTGQSTLADAALAGLSLDRSDREPMHGQLAAALKRLILAQTLTSGSRLPASRSFAEELGVSRATVVAAVEELIAEGYAEGRHGSGVYVAPDLPDHVLQAEAPDRAKPKAKLARPDGVLPFKTAAPELALFPHEIWARIMLRLWRAPSPELLANPDPLGFAPLRQAIAEHLGAFRGLTCSPDQVIVTSGAAEAAELLAQSVLARGDTVLVEEPGYPLMHKVLAEIGLELEPVAVDGEGFDIAKASKPARAVLVTPARHYPLGATMPLARRLALLDWARTAGAIIIEDDYDSEYRYHGRPLPALMGVDEAGVTIYLGSFSKTMLPGLRLAFLVAPQALLVPIAAAMRERGPRVSLMMQPVLAEFMRQGHYATHIRRMRRLYARRQKVLIAAIEKHGKGILRASPEPAGMHVIATIENGMDDREASRRAELAKIVAPAVSDYFMGKPTCSGLALGYAGFDEATIEAGVKSLVAALS
jgi:GntR family transcriptional regulator / MocR family aminotransferase